jgi:hypothetical protein
MMAQRTAFDMSDFAQSTVAIMTLFIGSYAE